MQLTFLVARVVAQSVAFVAVLAALALGCARTIDYWQAWALCGDVLACVLVIDVWLLVNDRALLERRLKMADSGEPTTTQKLLQACAGVSFFAMFLVAGFDRSSGWSTVPSAVSMAADLLVATGFGIVLLVFRSNTFASSVVEVESDQHVVTTGPYAVVRHPMYSGGLLLVVATPIALGSWWSLLGAASVAGCIVARLLDEEKMLARDLTGYRDYMRKTKSRLVPAVW